MSADRDSLVAIVAALPEELQGISRRAGRLRSERRGETRGRLGVVGTTAVVLVVTGDGARNAELGVRRLAAAFAPRRCLLVGSAGALTRDLGLGDVVAARRIVSAAGGAPAPDADWLARTAGWLPGATVFSADRIAASAAAKADLRRRLDDQGPAVVDLESASFASAAAAVGTPFLVLRAVSDLADEALPLDFERFRGPGGAVSRLRVAGYAALRPRTAARLVGLRRRLALCAERLADAVEGALAA